MPSATLFLYMGRIDVKNLIFKAVILVLILVSPIPGMANGSMEVGVSLPMPPVLVFDGPPHMVVIPDTYVYVVSDSDEDIFFYGGWWWRPWQGRWYRSHDYRSGWRHHPDIPSFYRDVPAGWRNDYSRNRWKGRQWEHRPIPHEQVEKNWNRWEKDRHWEKENHWGVHDVRPEAGPRQQNDRDLQQDARDRQRLGNDYRENNPEQQPDDRRERRQPRDAVEQNQPQPHQPQHPNRPQQRDQDRRNRQKDDRN